MEKSKNNPIITIGITAFNSGSFLKEALDSVLNQNNSQWKAVLILDGGANRESRRIYDNFQHPKFEKFKFEKNHGPFGTRNKAIEISSTEWYCHLDGDDLLPKSAVSDIIETIKNNPNADYIFGDCEKFSKNNSFIRKPYSDYEMLCYSPLFNGQSPIKKDLYLKLGGYDSNMYINADWDFWISIYENGIHGAYTDTMIYRQRKRTNNVGHKNIQLRPEIVDIIIKKHPKFFCNHGRINNAKYHVYSMLAQYYRSIGDRESSYKNAKIAMTFGKTKPVFESIFREKKMNFVRYMIRRLGRKIY